MPFSRFTKRSRELVQDSGKTMFRALGLNVLFTLFTFLRHQTVGKGYAEQTKIAIRRSQTTALLRALIHFIPVSVALSEIVLNWNTYFVGYHVYNLAYYQFGAKLHEIAIQASLSAVIFSYVRYELVLGDGIPFGALFSGLQISQASYLWSMEFWGTVTSKTISLQNRLRLLSVVTASIFIAAVAGPSSAILLVPRLDYWPAGSTNIWINITSDSLWPTRWGTLSSCLNPMLSVLITFSTNASDVPIQCLNASVSDIYTFACPSHGWEAVQDYMYTTANSFERKYLDLIHLVHHPSFVELTGRGSQRRLSITTFAEQAEGYDPEAFGVTTQQSAVADALTETGNLWTHSMSNVSASGHGSVLQRQDAVHTITTGYYQPYTVASCATDVIDGLHDDSALSLPIPPAVQPSLMLDQAKYNRSLSGIYSFVHPSITKDQIFGLPGSVEKSRLKWVELPQDPFNSSSIGAVVLLPRLVTNSTQNIVVCSLGAGWGASFINASSFDASTSFTTSSIDWSSANLNINPDQGPNEDNTFSFAETLAADSVVYFDLPFFPEKPITVTETWANYLNPFIPALNTTVIDALMSTNSPAGELGSLQQIDTAKWALGGLLASGLASIGATGTLQGDIKTALQPDRSQGFDGDYWFSGKGDMFLVDPEESKDWVKLRVHTTINGYAYNIRGAAPKVAITFLLIYCTIALSHVFYSGVTGKITFITQCRAPVTHYSYSGTSSTCWDSIGEVTALAMNSTPTTLLKNTCAGIMELNIFKIPVRVLATRDAEGEGEHLELVFGSVDEKDAKGTPIQPNRVYGTLPKMAGKEKSE